MTSDCNLRDFVSDSQNFTLRLSGDSIEDTHDLVGNSKTKDKDDIIVISDSSCNSSPEDNDKLKGKFNSNIKKNGKYQRLYLLETSFSESEEEKFNSPCKSIVRSDNKSPDRKYINTIQINKISSDETVSNGGINYDKNPKDELNKNNNKKFFKSPIRALICAEKKIIDSKMREKYNVKQANEGITSDHAVYGDCFNVSSRLNKFPVYNTPQQDNTGKFKLTKQDTHKILRNIKSTQIGCNSPKEKKENNIIIDESTDEDVIHPAISPSYNKKIRHNPNDSLDVIDTSLKNVNSQMDSKSYKTCSELLDILRKENLQKSLSKKKKKQIVDWLIANSPDSPSDSSCSNIPPSIRNSIDSGNSSLERLELNYETPNNRERINKVQTDKQISMVNSDKVIHSLLTRQTTLDKYFKKSNNISKFCTPDRPKSDVKVQVDKEVSSSINTPENTVTNYADILDKLYGSSWRNKANALLPITEPRKTSNQATSRIIQTER